MFCALNCECNKLVLKLNRLVRRRRAEPMPMLTDLRIDYLMGGKRVVYAEEE